MNDLIIGIPIRLEAKIMYRMYKPLLVAAVAIVAEAVHAEIRPVGYIQRTFIDITLSGTPLDLAGDSVAVVPTSVGNPVYPAGNVVIGMNGGVGFGFLRDNELPPENAELPSDLAFGGGRATLVFWDDLAENLEDKEGDVYWEEVCDEDDCEAFEALIVQWDAVTVIGEGYVEDTATFEVIIYDNFQDKESGKRVFAQFIYVDIEKDGAGGGDGATIGHQMIGDDPVLDLSAQVSFNMPGAVSDETMISFIGRCDGDVNDDGVKDPLDVGFVLASQECSVGTGDLGCDAADANRDGFVDPLDVGFVLTQFGQPQTGACLEPGECTVVTQEKCPSGNFIECVTCEEIVFPLSISPSGGSSIGSVPNDDGDDD